MNTNLSPESLKKISRYTRLMLKPIRTCRTKAELAMALAAARTVVSALERACVKADIPESALEAGRELARDLDTVMDLTGYDV